MDLVASAIPKIKKPANLIYGVDDAPPLLVVVSNGVQCVGLIAITLVYPLLVFRAIGTPVQVVTNLLAIAMLVLGVGAFLQAKRLGPMGSGFMCPATFTATYLAPSLLAAKLGGLPLVFGMTIFAGAMEAALAPLLHRLRSIFPPEISGVVILIIGLSAGISGLRTLLGDNASPVSALEWSVAFITLTSMVTLNVWGRGMVRMLCALLGLVVGYVAAYFTGLIDRSLSSTVAETPWIGLPEFHHVSWSFDIATALPFTIASLAVAMKAAGTIIVCQRTNDANWVRPDMLSVMRGVLADGVSTTVGGIAGTIGTNTATATVGLAAATGVVSRNVAYAVSAIFVLLSFFPKLPALLGVMPRAVIVPALLFAVTFIIINGIQVINSRLLDVRRTLVVGLSIVAGLAVEVFPSIAAAAPKAVAPLVASSLVFSTMTAVVLNLLLGFGLKKKVSFTIEDAHFEPQKIERFFESQGSKWGARADVVKRATFGTTQVLEIVIESCWRRGPLVIELTFDEFSLDVMISYEGTALEFPEQPPTKEQIRENEDGARLLAGFMLRRNADRVRSDSKDGMADVFFHFDH